MTCKHKHCGKEITLGESRLNSGLCNACYRKACKGKK